MDYTNPEIAARIVREHQESIRQAVHQEHLAGELADSGRAEVGRASVPWRLSVARLLYLAGDTLAGDHAFGEINGCR
ncbi:hypothetical protein EPN44_14895 [bacterium]|nr:MAG: hypothetical protein EPN44_14895 [bacterium]